LARTFCAALFVCIAALVAMPTSSTAAPLTRAQPPAHSLRATALAGQAPIDVSPRTDTAIPTDTGVRYLPGLAVVTLAPALVGVLATAWLFVVIGRRRR
jgi:hypothetical protein